jgi:hypothetical protein
LLQCKLKATARTALGHSRPSRLARKSTNDRSSLKADTISMASAWKASSSSSVTKEYDHARQRQFRATHTQADTLEQRKADRGQAAPAAETRIRTKLQIEQRTRDLAMFNLAIDSKLRGCDVVALKVDDVAPNGYAIDRTTVRQKKTGKPNAGVKRRINGGAGP